MNLKFAVVALTLVTVVKSSCLFGAVHEFSKLSLSGTGETVYGESEEYPAGDTYNETDTSNAAIQWPAGSHRALRITGEGTVLNSAGSLSVSSDAGSAANLDKRLIIENGATYNDNYVSGGIGSSMPGNASFVLELRNGGTANFNHGGVFGNTSVSAITSGVFAVDSTLNYGGDVAYGDGSASGGCGLFLTTNSTITGKTLKLKHGMIRSSGCTWSLTGFWTDVGNVTATFDGDTIPVWGTGTCGTGTSSVTLNAVTIGALALQNMAADFDELTIGAGETVISGEEDGTFPSTAVLAEGAVIRKTGTCTLHIQSDIPGLVVAEGTVSILTGKTLTSPVIPAGATVKFAGGGVVVNPVIGEGATVLGTMNGGSITGGNLKNVIIPAGRTVSVGDCAIDGLVIKAGATVSCTGDAPSHTVNFSNVTIEGEDGNPGLIVYPGSEGTSQGPTVNFNGFNTFTNARVRVYTGAFQCATNYAWNLDWISAPQAGGSEGYTLGNVANSESYLEVDGPKSNFQGQRFFYLASAGNCRATFVLKDGVAKHACYNPFPWASGGIALVDLQGGTFQTANRQSWGAGDGTIRVRKGATWAVTAPGSDAQNAIGNHHVIFDGGTVVAGANLTSTLAMLTTKSDATHPRDIELTANGLILYCPSDFTFDTGWLDVYADGRIIKTGSGKLTLTGSHQIDALVIRQGTFAIAEGATPPKRILRDYCNTTVKASDLKAILASADPNVSLSGAITLDCDEAFELVEAIDLWGLDSLTKTGEAALTLAQSVPTLVVSAGKAVVKAGSPAPGAVTVKGGATMAFNGSASETGPATLTVGDVSGVPGVLELLQDEEIRVGAVTLNAITLAYDGTYQGGTENSFVISATPLSAASERAWAMALSTGGFGENVSGSYTVVELPDGGGYALRMTAVANRTYVIELAEGASNATESIALNSVDTLNPYPHAGAELTLSGTYATGKFVKTGDGRATLDGGANAFTAMKVEAGTLAATDFASFGLLDAGVLTLEGGRVDLPAGEKAMSVFAQTASAGDPFTLAASGTTTLTGAFNAHTGHLEKCGAGTLELRVDGPSILTDGDLVIHEGELRLAAAGADGTFSVGTATPGHVYVGAPVSEAVGAQPGLIVDGIGRRVDFRKGGAYDASSGKIYLGDSNSNVLAPYFYVTNHAQVIAHSIVPCKRSGYHATVLVEDSNLQVGEMQDVSGSGYSIEYRIRNSHLGCGGAGSTMRSLSFRGAGAMTVDLDNSTWAHDTACTTLNGIETSYANASGTVKVRNGSILYCYWLYQSAPGAKLRLIFDDGEWRQAVDGTGGIKYIFGEDSANYVVEMQGKGLTLNCTSATRMGMRLTGTGGMTKKGAGDLVFETAKRFPDGSVNLNNRNTFEEIDQTQPLTLDFEGPLDVQEGRVVVAETLFGGKPTSPVRVGAAFTTTTGEGTVSGGTLASPRIVLSAADKLLAFDGTAFSGRVRVDLSPLGLAEPPKAPVTVATYTGAAPFAGKADARVLGFEGSNFGTLTCSDGNIVLSDVGPRGVLLIVR